MSAGWKGNDSVKAMRSLERALDNKHDPKYLDKIARKAKLDNVRKRAAEYKEELEGYVSRAEKHDRKCSKCGAPLVEVPYYTAVKGTTAVTNVKREWGLNGSKTTYNTSTPYSDIIRHTSPFCPRCASRKVKRVFVPTTILLFGGMAAVLVFGIMLIVVFKKELESLFPIAMIGLAVGLLMAVVGYKMLGTSKGTIAWAGRKRAPITTEELNARENGSAFYRSNPNDITSYNSAYDLSMQYIASTTFDKIPHEKKANIALSTGFVRQMQKNSHS